MTDKPINIKTLDDLLNYYWMKSDLIMFCKDNRLPTQGTKSKLIERIQVYLSTGKRLSFQSAAKKAERDSLKIITKETLVISYHNDAATRKFFVEHLGEKFKFNAYLRQFTDSANIPPKMTYGDLISGWLLAESNKTQNDPIAPQFEYNQFIRDYFLNEKGATLADAISIWKDLVSKRGPRTYRQFKKG